MTVSLVKTDVALGVSMSVSLVKTDVAYGKFVRGIANDIRRFGHYQERVTEYPHFRPMTALWERNNNRQGLCCIIANPTAFDLGQFNSFLNNEYIGRLTYDVVNDFHGIVNWSNETPTAEVLATLDAIAERNGA